MSKLLEVNYAGVVSLPGSLHVQMTESWAGPGNEANAGGVCTKCH